MAGVAANAASTKPAVNDSVLVVVELMVAELAVIEIAVTDIWQTSLLVGFS
jgi:hypothetical protein